MYGPKGNHNEKMREGVGLDRVRIINTVVTVHLNHLRETSQSERAPQRPWWIKVPLCCGTQLAWVDGSDWRVQNKHWRCGVERQTRDGCQKYFLFYFYFYLFQALYFWRWSLRDIETWMGHPNNDVLTYIYTHTHSIF